MAKSRHEGVKWYHHAVAIGSAVMGLLSFITGMYVPAIGTPTLVFGYICLVVMTIAMLRVLHLEGPPKEGE